MDGNQLKIREALEQASYFLRRHHMGAVYAPDGETLIFCEDVIDIVDEALSAPPRNCDIGTAEEQASRMRQFCTKQKRNGIINCGYCPIKHEYQRDCTLSWAQMPYEAEEGAGK